MSATAALRSDIRRHAKAAGAEAPELFNTRSFRRGHADSVARFGGKLSTILRAGNWSSRAFKEYLARDELDARATAEMVRAARAGQEPARVS